MADSLGDRMKDYESRTGTKLVRKVPAIIRVDGKAFHTYTKGCKKPFDADIIQCMQIAAVKTAETIQGFKMGYVQSDEASFLLSDMDNVESEAWFDYKVQKIVSVAASTFGAYFNQAAQASRRMLS
jgi:tRNA(His) 5'-end guanylyltransferase